MCSMAVIKQDLKINASRILLFFGLQMACMLMAIGICEMKLIEISDIFWDTIPVILIPMFLEMLLAYETITKCTEDGTMDLILATGMKPEKILRGKAAVIVGSGVGLVVLSGILGAGTKVYRLTGAWTMNSYLFLNAGSCCLQVFLGGVSYFAAAGSRNLKVYLKKAGIILVGMYILYLLYYLVPQLEFLQYVTIFSFYRQHWYRTGELMGWIGSAVLLGLGILFLITGKRPFYKRNLPK